MRKKLFLSLVILISAACEKSQFRGVRSSENSKITIGENSTGTEHSKENANGSASRNVNAAFSFWPWSSKKASTPAPTPVPTPAPMAKPSPKSETPPVAVVADSGELLKKEDLVPEGQLSPTIYFRSIIEDSDSLCRNSDRTALIGPGELAMIRVCLSTWKKCAMEGSCQISQNGLIRSFNVDGSANVRTTFFEIKSDECPFGYGVKSICLDPYYTVAADPAYHKAGDVIFLPTLRGLKLPDGSLHSGFLVVRDTGGRIRGPRRFDFFSGNLNWSDPGNPFRKLQLADSGSRLNYYKVVGPSAAKVLSFRKFPSLPSGTQL